MSTGERGAVRKRGGAHTPTVTPQTETSSTVKNGQTTTGIGVIPEDTPNHIVYKKVGHLHRNMASEGTIIGSHQNLTEIYNNIENTN